MLHYFNRIHFQAARMGRIRAGYFVYGYDLGDGLDCSRYDAMTKLQSLIHKLEYENRIGDHYSCCCRIIEVLKLLACKKQKRKKAV